MSLSHVSLSIRVSVFLSVTLFLVTDEMELCLFIRNQLRGTHAAPYFLSILQHLCLVRDDHIFRFVDIVHHVDGHDVVDDGDVGS